MGWITKLYQKNFLQRFDKDEAIPYACLADFPGLVCKEDAFQNKAGVEVRFFLYHYESYDPKKLILFCPGIGPGHTAYFAEIETLCKVGYRVLTLDYTGCGASGGERLPSINAPTKDARELLERLAPKEEIIVIGHSLGGYTALNLVHLMPNITRAIILSGFVSISDELMGFVKLRLLANRVARFEKKIDPQYGALDNLSYLKNTTDKILWIHSTDDPLVNYKHNAGRVRKLNNPNLRVITVEHKKHNPQYTEGALAQMYAWIGEYNRLVAKKELVTLDSKKAYFADKPVSHMTEQDSEIYKEILLWIQ